LDEDDGEKMTTTTLPELADILALHGRSFALLTVEERVVFDFFAARGRKYGVRLAVLKRTNAEKLLGARSQEEADELLRRADGVIEVQGAKDVGHDGYRADRVPGGDSDSTTIASQAAAPGTVNSTGISCVLEALIADARRRASKPPPLNGSRAGHETLLRHQWHRSSEGLAEALIHVKRAERYERGESRSEFATPWTVYALLDGDDVFYVGQTWMHPVERLFLHCTIFRANGRKKLLRIWKILQSRRVPRMRVLSVHHDELEAFDAEEAWRAHYHALGAPLTNYQTGANRSVVSRSRRQSAEPRALPPGTVWASPLPGAEISLSPQARRKVVQVFGRATKGTRRIIRARRQPASDRQVQTSAKQLPEASVARAALLRYAPKKTGEGVRTVSWRKVAEELAEEGLGEHAPGDVAYAVTDLLASRRRGRLALTTAEP
jgi:hypothetical protein